MKSNPTQEKVVGLRQQDNLVVRIVDAEGALGRHPSAYQGNNRLRRMSMMIDNSCTFNTNRTTLKIMQICKIGFTSSFENDE